MPEILSAVIGNNNVIPDPLSAVAYRTLSEALFQSGAVDG